MALKQHAQYSAVYSSSSEVVNFVDTYFLTGLVYEILVLLKQ